MNAPSDRVRPLSRIVAAILGAVMAGIGTLWIVGVLLGVLMGFEVDAEGMFLAALCIPMVGIGLLFLRTARSGRDPMLAHFVSISPAAYARIGVAGVLGGAALLLYLLLT